MWLKCSLCSKNSFLPYSRLFSSNSRLPETLCDFPGRFESSGVDCSYKMLLTVPRKKPTRHEKSTVHMQFWLLPTCWEHILIVVIGALHNQLSWNILDVYGILGSIGSDYLPIDFVFFPVISHSSSVDVKKLTVTAVFDCYKKLHTLLK